MRFALGVTAIVVFACSIANGSAQQAGAELATVDCSGFERVATGFRVVKEMPIVVSASGKNYVITPRQGDVIETDTIMIGGPAVRSLNLMIAGRCKL